MIITCPNCQTRYQIAEKAIGSAGRKVACAQCQQSWHAVPEPEQEKPRPTLVVDNAEADMPERRPSQTTADEEDEMDVAFADAEPEEKQSFFRRRKEKATKAKKPKRRKNRDKNAGAADKKGLDAALAGKRRRAMQKRQAQLRRKLPMGRIRSNLRFAALVLFAWLIGGGLYFRTEIVRVMPDLAGVYAAVGLPINVVGLEFEDVKTLRTLRNGVDVTEVTGAVRNITGKQVRIPAIVVSILDSDGQSLYSWSVTPVSRVVAPGEKLEFETQVNSAPTTAHSVKLAFAEDTGV